MNNNETENEIIFHDEEMPKEQVKGPNNKLGICSLVLAILTIMSIFISVMAPLYFPLFLATLITSIVALVQIKKKNQSGKKYAIIGLVIAILSVALRIVVSIVMMSTISEEEINNLESCFNATDCVDNKDGTSTCLDIDEKEIKCTTQMLDKSQYK